MNAKEYYDSKRWGNPNWDRKSATQFFKSEMFDFAESYAAMKLEEAKQEDELAKSSVNGSLPIVIDGVDIETLSNMLFEKWSLRLDNMVIMPKDLFTLAIQDIIRGSNDR